MPDEDEAIVEKMRHLTLQPGYMILDTDQTCCIVANVTLWVAKMADGVWWMISVDKGRQIQISAGISFSSQEETVAKLCELYAGYLIEFDHIGLFPEGAEVVPGGEASDG